MNKKLLICGVIATGLLLTACVKKESPQEDTQEQTQTTQVASEPTFEQLEEVQVETIPEEVEVERIETENTTTEIRRSVQPAVSTNVNSTPAAAPSSPAPTQTPTVKAPEPTEPTAVATPRPSNSGAKSQEDAVADAIAAAMPALEN